MRHTDSTKLRKRPFASSACSAPAVQLKTKKPIAIVQTCTLNSFRIFKTSKIQIIVIVTKTSKGLIIVTHTFSHQISSINNLYHFGVLLFSW